MKPTSRANTLNVWQVAALGIGSMVGAGIFALLGQTALHVKSETWIAFAAGGVIAMLSGYSYARLGASYPSSGGITKFFRVGFPPTLATALSMLYLITLALCIAMVARAFGDYGARLFHDPPLRIERVRLYAGCIVALLAVLNFVGSAAVGRAEVILVTIKLGILVLLAVAGANSLKPEMLQIHAGGVQTDTLLSSIGLSFFAYAGYGMMANAAADVPNPARTLRQAFILAIGVTMVLYIVLSLVVLGNVTPENLAKYADTAVAQAAYPVLGKLGFTIVSVGALLATTSSINATLFSALNITRYMGNAGELPSMFARPVWRESTPGAVFSVILILILTVTLEVSALANVASATFLVCYLSVFVIAWRLRHEIQASSLLLAVGFLLMLMVFVAFCISLCKQGWLNPAIVIAAMALSWLLALRARCLAKKKQQS